MGQVYIGFALYRVSTFWKPCTVFLSQLMWSLMSHQQSLACKGTKHQDAQFFMRVTFLSFSTNIDYLLSVFASPFTHCLDYIYVFDSVKII